MVDRHGALLYCPLLPHLVRMSLECLMFRQTTYMVEVGQNRLQAPFRGRESHPTVVPWVFTGGPVGGFDPQLSPPTEPAAGMQLIAWSMAMGR